VSGARQVARYEIFTDDGGWKRGSLVVMTDLFGSNESWITPFWSLRVDQDEEWKLGNAYPVFCTPTATKYSVMQAGFLVLEAGTVRTKSINDILLKVLNPGLKTESYRLYGWIYHLVPIRLCLCVW